MVNEMNKNDVIIKQLKLIKYDLFFSFHYLTVFPVKGCMGDEVMRSHVGMWEETGVRRGKTGSRGKNIQIPHRKPRILLIILQTTVLWYSLCPTLWKHIKKDYNAHVHYEKSRA